MTKPTPWLAIVVLAALTLVGCGRRDAAPPSVPIGQITEAPPQPPVNPDGFDPR
ncbi:MAG: hypothetical protein SNJ74_12380 [Fimbriimonadaceae bacterium]